MAGFNIERLVGNLLIIFGGAIFIGIIVALLFSVAKGADLTSLMGGDLFKKTYMADFTIEQSGSNVLVKWKTNNENELAPRRVYVVNDKNILTPDQLRSTRYDTLEKDFRRNAIAEGGLSKDQHAMTLDQGITRLEIVAINKKNEIVQKKEILFLVYDQKMLDRFSQKIEHPACADKNGCNVILCKQFDLSYKSIPSTKTSLKLTEKELEDLIKSLHSTCKTKIISLSGTGFGQYIVEPTDCTPVEIYSLFEEALTLKAQQKAARGEGTFDDLRQKLYDASYAKTCIDAVSTVLDERGWKAI